ncbi:chitin-binding type-2 domain-containing protein [Caerostris darwini]|uniref:Chitin-binding type-2 domain-containing protein n=1 Tax=Caerostris darwini TaxID=1538125 RepID=A0AAV4PEQ3_9ARAC|nr:chitin-binding type-2 domain-containing protein [Caerostris darwini]
MSFKTTLCENGSERGHYGRGLVCQLLPEYATIPKTSFSCDGRTYGYYADPEVNCQVFHICPGAYGVGHYSFLCPNQTVFNQAYLVCDHPTTWTVPRLMAYIPLTTISLQSTTTTCKESL